MKRSLTSVSISLAILGAFSLESNAQEINSDKLESSIERISVTANRRENLDTELAMSVHSVGEKELALDNGQHPADSLNSLAGVHIDQLSGGQGHKAAIRMPINVSGYYLYLQDNIPIQSPAFFNHNALWWSSFNSGAQRLEVLKGAGTALYGSGAVAATVNVLTKPVAQQAERTASAVFGGDAYGKVQYSQSNRIDENSGFRVSASFLKNNSWRDHTASQRAELNLRHETDLGKNGQLKTLLTVSDLEQEMAAFLSEEQLAADRTHSGLSDDVLAIDPLRKSQYFRLSTQWDFMLDETNVSFIPYVRHRTNDYTATWNKNMPTVESSVSSIGLLALANHLFDSGAEITAGMDLEISDGDQLSFQPIYVKTTGWGAAEYFEGHKFYDDTTRYTGVSPYLQYTHPVNDELTLTLGARYDYAGYSFDNHLSEFGDIGYGKLSLEDREDSFNHLSPKASLNYQLSDQNSVFLRYANAFRLPSAGSLYHITTKDSDEGISSLKPEVSDTYEIGYKSNGDVLTMDFALYYMDVDDGIVYAYNDDGQRYQVNASRVIHKGLEFAANWVVSDSTEISFAYSKTKHEFDDYGELSGNEMMTAPEHMTNVRVRYTPKTIPQLNTLLEFQALGDYWMDDANTERTDGYQLLNAKALYKVSDKLSFNARIINLTDKEYNSSARINYGRKQFAPGAPRTVYVGVNYAW